MDDLAQWCSQQLDIDERIARAVTTEGAWRVGSSHGGVSVEGEGWTVAGADALDGAHIAEHDPARVLREIDAKRRIVYLAQHLPQLTATTDVFDNNRDAWREVIKQLAAVYDQRPGYLEEWRP